MRPTNVARVTMEFAMTNPTNHALSDEQVEVLDRALESHGIDFYKATWTSTTWRKLNRY
jgi:hypothetical protein